MLPLLEAWVGSWSSKTQFSFFGKENGLDNLKWSMCSLSTIWKFKMKLKKYVYPKGFSFLVNNTDEPNIIEKCKVVLDTGRKLNKEKAKKIRQITAGDFVTRDCRAMLW